jgi:signal transduction histidine kinase
MLARLRRARAGMSLGVKLALLTTLLLAAGMGGLLLAIRGTLVDGAEVAARERLTRVVRDLALRTTATQKPRADKLKGATADPRVIAALRAGPSDPAAMAAARAHLASLALHNPDTSVVELWDATGRPLVHLGDSLEAALRDEPPPSDMGTGRIWYGSLRRQGDEVHVWTVTPVDDGGQRLGYVASMAWLRGRRNLPEQLRTLTGEDVDLLLRNADGSVWTTAAGTDVRVPDRRDSTAAGLSYWRGGSRTVAVEAAVPGTPWIVVIEGRESALLARPRITVRRLALLALALIVIGAIVAWRLGRRITRPLTALTSAAEEISRGTYEYAVPRGGGNEVDRLTMTFGSMARKVATAQSQLEQRAIDAQEYAAELARANARLRDAITDAEEASRAKSDFLAVMSHELRTPLNAIGGYTELLAMGIYGEVRPEQHEALSRIERSQRHLLSLIDDVLSFARLEGGQTEFHLRDFPLQEALAGVDALVAPQAQARRLALDLSACASLLLVRADPDKVRQIVLNLVANAIKFTPEAGRVHVRCEAAEDVVHVHVEDTGPGIPEDRVDAIFEPFVQGDRALNRPSEGVGLGLAISRDLAHGMGGTLTVRSTVGAGSTFTLALPRARGTPVGGTPPLRGPSMDAPLPSSSRR